MTKAPASVTVAPGSVTVAPADLADPTHAAAVRELVAAYAREPMGGGEPLGPDVEEALVPRLAAHPTTRIWLAWDGNRPVGAAVCFLGFSTFRARPLLNVHDLVVAASHRRRGLGRRLLEAAEAGARAEGCCRLTLEVRPDNAPARALYTDFGLGGSGAHEGDRPMYFLSKEIG